MNNEPSALGLAFTAACCLLLLIGPRRVALLPVLVVTCLTSMNAMVNVGGANFTTLRILVIFGWIRLMLRRETGRFQYTRIDWILVGWATSSTIAYCLLWQSPEAVINRLGHAYDTFGLFLLFRNLIKTWDDMQQTLRLLSLCIAPLACLMVYEKLTGQNLFAYLGGAPLFSMVRDGAIRAQGPFGHPILAGTFAATNIALFYPLWAGKKGSRLLGALGFASGAVMIVASASSGPLLTLLAVALGLVMWIFRWWMRSIRVVLAIGIVILQLLMKAPIWFLIARVSLVSGSTGFHRARLIDAAINHFDEWFLIGTKSTGEWGYYLFDVTNEYIAQGVAGGFLTLVLFILLITRCFGAVGWALRRMNGRPHVQQIGVWALGVALLAHCVSYISVSYFDQNIVTWFLLVAMISRVREKGWAEIGLSMSTVPSITRMGEFHQKPVIR